MSTGVLMFLPTLAPHSSSRSCYVVFAESWLDGGVRATSRVVSDALRTLLAFVFDCRFSQLIQLQLVRG